MKKMKTLFRLQPAKWMKENKFATMELTTLEKTSPVPFVFIEVKNVGRYFIKNSDLETFATNILKSLKEKP